MPFNPRTEYAISSKLIPIGDFFHYTDEFVTRPPYQRKSVWSNKKKQALLDSLFRRLAGTPKFRHSFDGFEY